jgi:oligoribonuclease NrnB/cAMP/cGMP phosphodiesterase (DHH superfamily)
VIGRDVYLVDFSYKRGVVESMLGTAKSVTLIDHHKTALEDLAGLAGLAQFTDLERSGAGLAWDFCFPNIARPQLLNHVEDRDLWKFKLPHTREIQAAVFSYEYDFEVWSSLMTRSQKGIDDLIVEGTALERKHFKDIKELVKLCERTMDICGWIVPVASLPYTFSSDAGHLMAQAMPFAACYWDTDDHRIFSLRSTDAGLDVSEIAKAFGGGGHAKAAGFRVPRDHILARS